MLVPKPLVRPELMNLLNMNTVGQPERLPLPLDHHERTRLALLVEVISTAQLQSIDVSTLRQSCRAEEPPAAVSGKSWKSSVRREPPSIQETNAQLKTLNLDLEDLT